MAAFLEPPDGRKTRHAIFRLHVRKNFFKAAMTHFLENRLELCGFATATHGNPRIPGICQRGESSRTIRRPTLYVALAAPIKQRTDRPPVAGQEGDRLIVTTSSISNQLSSPVLRSSVRPNKFPVPG